ncbi:MAG: hypothetical protein KBD03_01570 [Gammaproteobacteria bacterium]|nr:hypothetical protein [Gammaproteobacteria bacterium]
MKKNILLSDYLKVADIHAARLQGALEQSAQFMPLSAERLATLPLNQLSFLDMMTMRFGKLQDVIGENIFSLILNILGEDAASLIDKLNKLEKLGYIDDVNWWMDLREIRNQVMHDYPNDYALIVSHISMLTIKANELLLFWDVLKTKISTLP